MSKNTDSIKFHLLLHKRDRMIGVYSNYIIRYHCQVLSLRNQALTIWTETLAITISLNILKPEHFRVYPEQFLPGKGWAYRFRSLPFAVPCLIASSRLTLRPQLVRNLALTHLTTRVGVFEANESRVGVEGESEGERIGK